MQKKPFVLLEILIALSLMAVLVTLLLSFMVQSVRVENKIENARDHILQRQNLQIRLQDIFTSLSSGVGTPPLYTQRFPKEEFLSLVTLFDNGIDPDPAFSGTVIGRIFVDENRNLSLVYWPHDKSMDKRPWRKEILLEDVSDISMSFLSSNEKEHLINTPKPKILWDRAWEKNKAEPPSAMRFVVRQNGQNIEFAFRLPNSHPIPTYLSFFDFQINNELPYQVRISA